MRGMVDHVAVRKASDGQFYWLLVGHNGEIVGVSEEYTRRADAKRGARRIIASFIEFVLLVDESHG